MADALVVGCLLITLLSHADRVRIACLAQLVNVIPAIRTVDGGPALLQTFAYPFADVAHWGRGTVLELDLDGPTYEVEGEGAVNGIEATAVHDPHAGSVTLFAVNRLERPLALEATVRDLGPLTVEEHTVLSHADIRASNTAADPERVVPRPGRGASIVGGQLTVELPPRSWNVVRLAGSASRPVSPLRRSGRTAGVGWR